MSDFLVVPILLVLFLMTWNDFTAMRQFKTLSAEVARMKTHYDSEIAGAFELLEDYINEGDSVPDNPEVVQRLRENREQYKEQLMVEEKAWCSFFADGTLSIYNGSRVINRPLEDWFNAMREKIEDEAVDALIAFSGEESAGSVDETRSLEQEG